MLRRGPGEIAKGEVGDAKLYPRPGQVFDRQAQAALDCLTPENDSSQRCRFALVARKSIASPRVLTSCRKRSRSFCESRLPACRAAAAATMLNWNSLIGASGEMWTTLSRFGAGMSGRVSRGEERVSTFPNVGACTVR